MRIFSQFVAAVLLTAAAVSCGKNTSIEGTLHEGAGESVIVKLLDVNRFQVLDTVKVSDAGTFRYALDVEAGKPEFIYLFHGERQIASLLLKKGDKVNVNTDTLGVYTVEGSEESLKLQQVEKDYAAFIREMDRILNKESEPDAALSRCYVQYYRDRVKYVMGNMNSLTVVPVLFQQVNPSLPVFSQSTDGILMRNVADSLKTFYPESRYVKALDKEAARRVALMDVEAKISSAKEMGFIDMSLPGMDGKPVQLSDAVSKVTMLYFWASSTEQTFFTVDNLLPLYQEFHPKGFEIYAVSLDSDKAAWASAVRNQKLPWINVCDTRGAASPYVLSYGIGSLPMVWFITDGTIDTDARVRNAADIRAYLRRNL